MTKFQVGDRLVYPSRGISWLNAIRPVSVDDVAIPSLILTAEDRGSSLAVPVAQAERGVLQAAGP
jgi:RNA polymerase-interacting CarD/CdnL/TRCF family regulator